MTPRAQLQLLAQYNLWQNQNLYSAADKLPAVEVTLERGAFFGSIQGTLNHLAVADTIWLKRFATLPACKPALERLNETPRPTRLDEPLFPDFASLRTYRHWLDGLIAHFATEVPEEALSLSLTYANMKGVESTRNLFALLMHFFNHQTHHRGQVSTLLSQAGVDLGITDLLPIIPQVDVQA